MMGKRTTSSAPIVMIIIVMLIVPFAANAAQAGTYEFLVWKTSGNANHEVGDFIARKPAPAQWGAKEMRDFAIVSISGLSDAEAAQLCRPLYKDDDPGTIDNPNPVLAERKYRLEFSVVKALNPVMREADFSAFGGGIYSRDAKTQTSTCTGAIQPLKAVPLDFRTTAGIYDKYQAKDITFGTIAIEAK